MTGPPRDPLIAAIESAATPEEVHAVYNAHANAWTPEHANAGTRRLMHLANVQDEVRTHHPRRCSEASRRDQCRDSPRPDPLADMLAVADDPVEYRVSDLWPVGGRVLLAAQDKSGKSTAVLNLARSLADGKQFLGRFDTRPGRVALVDDELDERTRWADTLRGADVLMFDCLLPVLDALGLDENREAGRFLVVIDAEHAAERAAEAGSGHAKGVYLGVKKIA